MYTALLLFAAAVGFFYGDAWKLACWLLLALVLFAKSMLEERALTPALRRLCELCQKCAPFPSRLVLIAFAHRLER